jgi:hypothetical protein
MAAARTDLSESDWDTLAAVPFAVLFLVGNADGGVARAERRAFAAIVDELGTSSRASDSPLVREVLGRISRDPGVDHLDGQGVAGLTGVGLPIYEVLAGARELLDGMPQQADAHAFKRAMVHLAHGIARAWPIVGRRTSAEEARSIRFIGEQLGLDGAPAIVSGPAPARGTAAA